VRTLWKEHHVVLFDIVPGPVPSMGECIEGGGVVVDHRARKIRPAISAAEEDVLHGPQTDAQATGVFTWYHTLKFLPHRTETPMFHFDVGDNNLILED